MKRILIDVDAVIADLHTEWLKRYNQDYEDTLTIAQITEWDMTKFVKLECGNKIFDYLWMPDLYTNVLPIDGAISSIHWLRQHNYDVRFLTSGVQESKINWLGNHGLLMSEYFLSSPDVIVSADKSVIDADIMVDDYPKNLESFKKLRILFAQPWNEGGYSYFRAYNWPDVIQYIAYVERGKI